MLLLGCENLNNSTATKVREYLTSEAGCAITAKKRADYAERLAKEDELITADAALEILEQLAAECEVN